MKEFDIKALGRRITFHREQLNLSRNDLHKLSGVSEGYLSNLENGIGSRLNIQTLCQIANALQLSVDELLIDSLKYFSLTNDTQVIMDIVNSFDEREAKMYLALIQDYFNSREN